MFDFRESPEVRSPYKVPQIGLPELVAPSCRTPPKFHSVARQGAHDSIAKFSIRAPENKREGVIAASLGPKIGAIEVRIQVVQE